MKTLETPARARSWMRRWRVKEKTGFVIFFAGQACGWSCDLPEPYRNRPGCIALNLETGAKHEASGGNYQDGHAGWHLLTEVSS